MGKKAKKKNDSRGYVTHSAPPSSSSVGINETDISTTSTCEAPHASLTHSDEHEETKGQEDATSNEFNRRVLAEMRFIKAEGGGSAYRGQLCAPSSAGSDMKFMMPSEYILQELLDYTKEVDSWDCFSLSSVTYNRFVRILHALLAVGIDDDIACKAVIATSGFDERAAIEWVIDQYPNQLPKGWREYEVDTTAVVDTVRPESVVKQEQELQAQADMKRRYAAQQQAQELVQEIERHNDCRLMPSQTTDAELHATPTDRYMYLLEYKNKLHAAVKNLQSSKEKKVVKERLREVGSEMGSLRSSVDFRLLEEMSTKSVDNVSADPCVENPSEHTQEDMIEEEPGIMGLFDEDSEVVCTGKQKSAVFEYKASRKHSSPLKILSNIVPESRRFTPVSQGASKWRMRLEAGPLNPSTAKQLSVARGTVLLTEPTEYALDEESSRQLAALLMLHKITPVLERSRVFKQLARELTDVWEAWITDEENSRENEIRKAAEKRVTAIETALEEATVTKKKTTKDVSCPATRNSRQGMNIVTVYEELERRRTSGRLKLEDSRKALPVTAQAKQIVDLISHSDVCVVCGETGSGKSTQVPQLILREALPTDHGVINIIVTEPRRVAAVSVSARVSAEIGDNGQSDALCGYTVRLDSNVGPKCAIEYVTIGVLLRRLQATNGACLNTYSHVIVDEVHERSVDSDLLLLLLREYMKDSLSSTATARIFPHVVLMSATADSETLMSYWREASNSVTITHVPGRTFPVSAHFLEDVVEDSGYGDGPGDGRDAGEACESFNDDEDDESSPSWVDELQYSSRTCRVVNSSDLTRVNYDLLHHIIRYELLKESSDVTHDRGAVLVFLPGMEEIRRVIRLVEGDPILADICVPLPMHSSLPFNELQKAFSRVNPPKRKLIVSTNIAETGVTIEDVDLVIDSGLVKSMEWNEVTQVSLLRMHLCSAAEAMQRRGRAGRVRAGKCIHMFPRRVMEGSEGVRVRKQMKRRPIPEMKRAPLTYPILTLIDQSLPATLLLSAPGDTVSQSKLTHATQTLVELGAIRYPDTEEATGLESNCDAGLIHRQLFPTPLGQHLAALPCDPKSGKSLLAARVLGCAHAAAVFIATLDSKSIFSRSERTYEFFRSHFGKRAQSDAVAVVNVYTEWILSSRKYAWCRENGISMTAMTQVAEVVDDLLRSLGVEKATRDGKRLRGECTACRSDIGMHICVTGGSKESLHAALAVGLGNNVAYRTTLKSGRTAFLSNSKSDVYSEVHSSSMVSTPGEVLVYSSKMANLRGTQQLFNVATINRATMMLFSPWTNHYTGDGVVIVGNGIGVRCFPQTLVALRKFRSVWEKALIDGDTSNLQGFVDICMKVIKST